MNIVQELKEKITVPDIYPKRLDGKRGQCALHDNTSSPSFIYYPNDDTWCCFSCGVGGDAINLYSHINNISNTEAIKQLCLDCGIELDKESLETHQKREQILEAFDRFADYCHKNLKVNASLYKKTRDSRGFTNETMERYKIGLFDEVARNWVQNEFDQEFCIEAGWLNTKGNFIFDYRIVYPYFDHSNHVVYFIYRMVDDKPDFNQNGKYLKQIKTPYVKEVLFGEDSLSQFRDKPLIITEGITDAISVIECNYPCLSPVTLKFKDEHIGLISKKAKRFEKVVIINDNEESNRGTEGAEKTLKVLLKEGINAHISIIPNPEGLAKIDLDDYLKAEGEAGLDLLVSTSVYGYDYFIQNLTEASTQLELELLMELIPEKQVKQRNDVFKEIKKRCKINIPYLREIYKNLLIQKKESFEQEEANAERIQREKDEVSDEFEFHNRLIEVRKDGVWRIKINKEGILTQLDQILEGNFKLVHKTRYLNRDYFSYEFNGNSYNTQSRTLMLMELRHFIYGGESGKDIVKKLINRRSTDLSYKFCKTTLGFDNGWVLPQLEDENDYKILLYTDVQRRIFENCKKQTKEYTLLQRNEIRKKLLKLLDITQMRPEKVAIIIGWCMAAPFKLPLLKHHRLFPGLMLNGDRQSGKTYIASFFAVDFYKAWSSYLAGSTIKKESRCEDILATSTFPIHLDELEYVPYVIIEIMKSTLTGVHDYVRKLSVIEEIVKPEVAPFVITTNNSPRPFQDPALNSKMIVIDFEASEVIVDDPKWGELYNELKKEKLFTFMYEHTKTWKDKDVFSLAEEIEKEEKFFGSHSRLKKKYLIIRFGLRIFRDIFDIDLSQYLHPDLLASGERFIAASLFDKFIDFCQQARDFDIGSYDDNGNYRRGNNPPYLTSELIYEERYNSFMFTQRNLRDFNQFNDQGNHQLRPLVNLIMDAIRNKEYIEYNRFYVKKQQIRCMKINPKVLTSENLDDI